MGKNYWQRVIVPGHFDRVTRPQIGKDNFARMARSAKIDLGEGLWVRREQCFWDDKWNTISLLPGVAEKILAPGGATSDGGIRQAPQSGKKKEKDYGEQEGKPEGRGPGATADELRADSEGDVCLQSGAGASPGTAG